MVKVPIRMQADDFLNSFHILEEHNEKVKPISMVPAIVNLAFAVELYIKNIYHKSGHKVPRQHNIFKLYKGLSRETRRKIFFHDSVNQNYYTLNDQIFSSKRFSGISKNYYRFLLQLKHISNSFRDWRYPHDQTKITVLNYNTGFVLSFIDALKSVSDDIRSQSIQKKRNMVITKWRTKEEDWDYWLSMRSLKLFEFIWLQKGELPYRYDPRNLAQKVSNYYESCIEATMYSAEFEKVLSMLKAYSEDRVYWRDKTLRNAAEASISKEEFLEAWSRCGFRINKKFNDKKKGRPSRFSDGALDDFAKECAGKDLSYQEFMRLAKREFNIAETTVRNNYKASSYKRLTIIT